MWLHLEQKWCIYSTTFCRLVFFSWWTDSKLKTMQLLFENSSNTWSTMYIMWHCNAIKHCQVKVKMRNWEYMYIKAYSVPVYKCKKSVYQLFIGSSLHQDLYQINTTAQDGDLNVLLNCLTCIIWIGWISSDSSVGLWTVDQEFESDWGILYLLNSILDLFKSKFHIFSPFWLLKPVLLMHHNILYNQITLSIIKR